MSWSPIPPEIGPGRFAYFVCYLLRELNLAETPTKQQLGDTSHQGQQDEQLTKLMPTTSLPNFAKMFLVLL